MSHDKEGDRMSDKRQYFKIRIKPAPRAGGTLFVNDTWEIISIAGLDAVATGIPTKEYAEAMRLALEKELSK